MLLVRYKFEIREKRGATSNFRDFLAMFKFEGKCTAFQRFLKKSYAEMERNFKSV